jgi:probable rRNA maturation factor
MAAAIDIDIAVDEKRWAKALPGIENLARDSVLKTLDMAGIKNNLEVSLRFADDKTVHQLNKEYRGKDKPTNVLSFPQDEDGMLGDVVLAFETVEREAREQEKTFSDHTQHLVVHGVLHLIGHDHEEDGQAEEMEKLEIRILAALGVKNPYETGRFMS